jgi:anaerobic glycerol-3-phosphate dehydrogenase
LAGSIRPEGPEQTQSAALPAMLDYLVEIDRNNDFLIMPVCLGIETDASRLRNI